ncbi:MAG TPA: molybdopterin-dependent oxidoreductase [Gaiellaceae bacterium]|nr:molybdopterin-dependent oxidoreductase [Gaiellaceae bacterium]
MSAQREPELVTVTIDGREVEAPRGQGMVETALAVGVEIPVFCYEPRLGPPVGACRMCLCEVEGMPKLQAACTLTAQDGMVLRTAQTSAKAAEGQHAILEFILLNHPLDCPDCDKGGECPLQDLTFRFGPGNTRMQFPKRTFDKPIPISPLIALDRERCILCYRCTRFSENVAEDGQLVAVNRGAQSLIATFQDEPYRARFSGNVLELCPVGALTSTTYRFRARPWEIQNVPTVCGLCPVGCNVWATTREGKVARVLSRNHPDVHEGWLCDKGRFAYDHLRAPDRIRTPLLRVRRRGFEEVSAERALDEAARGLREADGPVLVALSGAETVEQATALARIATAAGGGAALLPDDWDPALDAFRAPLSAIRDADVCLVLGDDPVAERAPIVDLWLRAARRGGAEVVTVGPSGSVQAPPGAAAQTCAALRAGKGLPQELRAASRSLRAAERVALVWSEDDPTGGRHVGALASELRRRTKADVAVYVLPRTPNGRGVAAAWHAAGAGTVSDVPEGEVGALVVSGDEAAYDPRVVELSGRARFVLAVAMFQSEVTAWADVVLPAASYLESDGTFVNLEGRPQRLRRAAAGPGPDPLELLSGLAARLGVAVDPWAAPRAAEQAELPPARDVEWSHPDPEAPTATSAAPGLDLLRYRPLFSGAAVERVAELQFQRPPAEVEIAFEDARARGIATGDAVSVTSNGTSVELRARVDRRLRGGVVRIAADHSAGLEERVQVVRLAAGGPR